MSTYDAYSTLPAIRAYVIIFSHNMEKDSDVMKELFNNHIAIETLSFFFLLFLKKYIQPSIHIT